MLKPMVTWGSPILENHMKTAQRIPFSEDASNVFQDHIVAVSCCIPTHFDTDTAIWLAQPTDTSINGWLLSPWTSIDFPHFLLISPYLTDHLEFSAFGMGHLHGHNPSLFCHVNLIFNNYGWVHIALDAHYIIPIESHSFLLNSIKSY